MSTFTSEMTLGHAANIRIALSTQKYEEETVKQDSVQDRECQGGRVIQTADTQWKKYNLRAGIGVKVIL